MPAAAARSTARLDGAPTAATIGMPAAWRLLHQLEAGAPASISTPRRRGQLRPRAAAGPPACRRRCGARRPRARPASAPSGVNSAAACSPPVRSKVACAARSAPGSPWITAARRHASRRPAAGARPPASPSRSARPHTPHAALVTNARALAASAAAAAGASSTRTLSSPICSAPRSAPRPPARPRRAGSRPPARRPRRASASSSTAPARRRPSAPGSAAAARSRPDRAPRS